MKQEVIHCRNEAITISFRFNNWVHRNSTGELTIRLQQKSIKE